MSNVSEKRGASCIAYTQKKCKEDIRKFEIAWKIEIYLAASPHLELLFIFKQRA